jgi:hypothetical protein
MADYPTRNEVADNLTAADLDGMIADLSSWQRTPRTVCELSPGEVKVTPNLLHAWAYLAEALLEYLPTGELDGFKITRPLDREELEEAAISARRNSIYSERQAAEKAAEAAKVELPYKDAES